MEPTSYHQLGFFVAKFQRFEDGVSDLMRLLAKADDEMVNILINELEYSKRLKTVDVLFSRFLAVRKGSFEEQIAEFHKLMTDLQKLGERRNELVHSKYTDWQNVEGRQGLLRESSKLRSSKREEVEESLMPEDFQSDFALIGQVAQRLESFRLKIIDWIYLDMDA
jgi:hypothetical protein